METSGPALAQPAPRWAVFGTAAAMVAAMAIVLPLISAGALAAHVVVGGWIPALWGARLAWAAHRGAIRQRIGSRETPLDDETRWTLVLRNPTVLTRRGQPFRFRVYFAMEFVFCLLVWLAVLGPVFVELSASVNR